MDGIPTGLTRSLAVHQTPFETRSNVAPLSFTVALSFIIMLNPDKPPTRKAARLAEYHYDLLDKSAFIFYAEKHFL